MAHPRQIGQIHDASAAYPSASAWPALAADRARPLLLSKRVLICQPKAQLNLFAPARPLLSRPSTTHCPSPTRMMDHRPLVKRLSPWRLAPSSSPSSPRAGRSVLPAPRVLVGAALFMLCCLFSFALGRYSIADVARTSIPLSEYTYVFKYNRTFGESPSPQSDAAWDSVFPEYGGYITHPEIAPTRSAIAVFHQLHCLNSLRKAFWLTYDMAQNCSSSQSGQPELPHHLAPPHMRHCIDLLRQSLMCQPDLAIEALNEELGGVTGFGTAHQCKDWSQLYGFASDWEYYGVSEERKLKYKAWLKLHGPHQ